MAYRLARAAEDQIDAVLLESARRHGIEAAGRYSTLLLAVMAALGDDPSLPGFTAVDRLPGIRAYPARLSRARADPAHRVRMPRHLIVYRVAADRVTEILGVVHDRMVLPGQRGGLSGPPTRPKQAQRIHSTGRTETGILQP